MLALHIHRPYPSESLCWLIAGWIHHVLCAVPCGRRPGVDRRGAQRPVARGTQRPGNLLQGSQTDAAQRAV